MPGSKVRKKTTVPATGSTRAGSSPYTTTRLKVSGPSSPVYIGIMLGLMVLGLLWLVVFYLWGTEIEFMNSLGNWNFGIGFAFMIAGLLMTMRWR